MLILKERPPGALWIKELLLLIENASKDDVIYHCYINSRRPTKMKIKDLKSLPGRIEIIKHKGEYGLGHLDHLGCNLSAENTYNDAYLFDIWLCAEAYLIRRDHDQQKSS